MALFKDPKHPHAMPMAFSQIGRYANRMSVIFRQAEEIMTGQSKRQLKPGNVISKSKKESSKQEKEQLKQSTDNEVNRLLPLIKEKIKKKSWFVEQKKTRKVLPKQQQPFCKAQPRYGDDPKKDHRKYIIKYNLTKPTILCKTFYGRSQKRSLSKRQKFDDDQSRKNERKMERMNLKQRTMFRDKLKEKLPLEFQSQKNILALERVKTYIDLGSKTERSSILNHSLHDNRFNPLQYPQSLSKNQRVPQWKFNNVEERTWEDSKRIRNNYAYPEYQPNYKYIQQKIYHTVLNFQGQSQRKPFIRPNGLEKIPQRFELEDYKRNEKSYVYPRIQKFKMQRQSGRGFDNTALPCYAGGITHRLGVNDKSFATQAAELQQGRDRQSKMNRSASVRHTRVNRTNPFTAR